MAACRAGPGGDPEPLDGTQMLTLKLAKRRDLVDDRLPRDVEERLLLDPAPRPPQPVET